MEIESIIQLINKKIDKKINLFNYELNAVLKKIAKLLEVRGLKNISDPLNFDFEFQKILKESGYYDLVNNLVDKGYDSTYNDIKILFSATGLNIIYNQSDIEQLTNLKRLDIDFFEQIGVKASEQLKRDIYKYSISDMDDLQIIENLKKSLEDTELFKYSRAYAETSISNYNQEIIDLKSKDVTGEVYIYRGVNDKNTRKFCKCLLEQNKYYDKKDAQNIKNDKRRQFNCRHLIVPVSKQWAEDRGYTSGSFTC